MRIAPMRITTVGYGRGTYFPDSQQTNEYLYLEAQLQEDEDFEICLQILREQVSSRIGVEAAIEDLYSRRCDLQKEIKELEDKAKAAKEAWEKIKAFYEKVRIPLENPDYDPIPF
jgi:chromosome segregation ATPase